MGHVGQVHPLVQEAYRLPQPVWALELDLERLAELRSPVRSFRGLPRFPGVERDIAFVLAENVPAEEAERVLREAGGELLESAELFDVYQGEGVAPGCRSLAFRLRYRAPDRTLTEAEVAEVHERVRKAVASQLGASLRS
ncbi:MAG: hypothetical protein IRY95_02010 [Clostridia bacterium]|nr:hypothetical protein [Clostridia bacterium]